MNLSVLVMWTLCRKLWNRETKEIAGDIEIFNERDMIGYYIYYININCSLSGDKSL